MGLRLGTVTAVVQGTPSFLTSVRAPELFLGRRIAGGRIKGQDVVYQSMVTRSKLTSVLSLLIVVVQFAGVGAVTSGSSSRASAEYYCCCPGECHCTADCCHHAPPGVDDGKSNSTRIGSGSPILEAPRSCGVWTGTLNRSPNAPKAIPAAERNQFVQRPEQDFRRLPNSVPTISSHAGLRASAPRAPPESVDLT